MLAENGTIAFHDTGNHVGVRKFIIELYTDLNDGTFSLINMPYGGPGSSGTAILKKNCWAKQSKGITFDFICNGYVDGKPIYDYHGNDALINVDEVYKKEREWYHSMTKVKK